MTGTQERLFSDVAKDSFKHENAVSMAESINKQLKIIACDFEDIGDMKTTYLQEVDEKGQHVWHFTTSKVVYEQIQKIKDSFNEGAIKLTLVKVKNYYKVQ